jgi:hypothetical protein
MDYFEQEGLTQSSPWALVDIGWTLKTQRSLRKILGDKVQGYYLGLSRDRISRTQAGRYISFLLQHYEPSLPAPPGDCLFRYARLIEQVFTMADHPSLTKYQRQGNLILPQLQEVNLPREHQEFVARLHEMTLSYAKEMAENKLLPQHWQELKKIALWGLRRLLTQPTRDEAQTLGWVSIGDDQNESRRHRLAQKLWIKDIFILGLYIFRRVLKGRADFPPQYAWLEGSVALSNPGIKLLFALANFARRLYQRVC